MRALLRWEEGNNHSCHGATRQYRRRRYFVHHMCRFSMTKRNNEATTRKTFFLQSSSPLLLTYLCCKRVLGDLWCAPAKYCGSDCFCLLVTHCTYINSALNNNDGGGGWGYWKRLHFSPFTFFTTVASKPGSFPLSNDSLTLKWPIQWSTLGLICW